MATRMNMLKLLQEVRGFAQFPSLPAESGPTGPLLLQFRGPRSRKSSARRKKFIRVDMQEPTDIPHPVQITYLPSIGL